MNYRITTDIEVDEATNTTKILSTTLVPITIETVPTPSLQGKQQSVEVIQPAPGRIPTPAPVGQQSSSGKGDWFKGTSWGN